MGKISPIGTLALGGLALSLIVLAGLGFWWFQAAPAVVLTPDDPAVVSRGESLYVQHCASCHGVDLSGEPDWRTRKPSGRLPAPPHDVSGHTWHHPDQQLFRITKLGVGEVAGLDDYQSDMPAYAGILSDAEILAVLSYIKSTWPAQFRRRHDELNRQAGG